MAWIKEQRFWSYAFGFQKLHLQSIIKFAVCFFFLSPRDEKKKALLSSLEVHLPLKHPQGHKWANLFILIPPVISLSTLWHHFCRLRLLKSRLLHLTQREERLLLQLLKENHNLVFQQDYQKRSNNILLLYLFCAFIPITARIGISLELLLNVHTDNCAVDKASYLFYGVWYVFSLPIRRNRKGLMMLKGKKEQLQLRKD